MTMTPQSTPQPKEAPKRKPRKLASATTTTAPPPPPPPQEATKPTTEPKEPKASPDPRPSTSRRRSRPKKLPSDRTPPTDLPPSNDPTTLELVALKARVQGLEARVRELASRPAPPPDKPADKPSKGARRRLRRQRTEEGEGEKEGSDKENAKDGDEGETGELARVETELAVAKGELEGLSARADAGRAEDVEEDEVEEIPRGRGAGKERAVVVSGRYRIPIPEGVDDTDLQAVQRGIRSAQRVARGYLESRRESAGVTARSDIKRTGSSWSEWFGGYSVSLARVVSDFNVQPEGGVPVPPPGLSRSNTAPSGRRSGKAAGGKDGGRTRGKPAGERPAAARSTQELGGGVAGLLS
ncbi:hypothetical protein EJ06DRAFT_547578 [Trichodelitschia bisporula]|uniref:Uncharacterized protein n=1 Tax=Trichodelitschia bisporula TaxID=703511 RepID=A0A6G1I1V7_9PEZI|nr:hypothetical protein EJ06DRAFT_547578 [Trichodelitschia bisporula]